nr:hypothetical protein [uncultured Flavobacterium sp.]
MWINRKEGNALKIVSRTLLILKLLDTILNSKAVALPFKITRRDVLVEDKVNCTSVRVIFKARQMWINRKEGNALKIVSRTLLILKLLDTILNSNAVALPFKITRRDVKICVLIN